MLDAAVEVTTAARSDYGLRRRRPEAKPMGDDKRQPLSGPTSLTALPEDDVDIQFLVERLEALVVNARKVPMTSQVILEQAAVLDLIDQLRVAIPEEVKQARRINQESDRVISKAREESEGIIGAAQEQAALLLQDQSILREAESRAQKRLEVLEERKPQPAES